MGGDLLVAFAAGAVSFFAPCVVPLLPAYVSYLGGAALPQVQADPRAFSGRMVRGGLLFVTGFGVVFVLLGVAAGLVGAAALEGQRVLIQRLGGGLIIVMGLALLGLLPARLGERSFSLLGSHAAEPGARQPIATPLLLGLVFGTAWTPCVGPVLSAILGLAAARGEAVRGGLLLTVYAAGLGLPFVLCSLLVASFPSVVRPLARFSVVVSRSAGALMVVLGLLLLVGVYQSLAGYLAQPFTLR